MRWRPGNAQDIGKRAQRRLRGWLDQQQLGDVDQRNGRKLGTGAAAEMMIVLVHGTGQVRFFVIAVESVYDVVVDRFGIVPVSMDMHAHALHPRQQAEAQESREQSQRHRFSLNHRPHGRDRTAAPDGPFRSRTRC